MKFTGGIILKDDSVRSRHGSLSLPAIHWLLPWASNGAFALPQTVHGNLERALFCRYCYQSQPQVMQWNLAQLGSALLAADLLSKEEAQKAVDAYGPLVVRLHEEGWAAKLGMPSYSEGVSTRFMKLMAASESDMTNTFRALTALSHEEAFSEIPDTLQAACSKSLSDEDKQV